MIFIDILNLLLIYLFYEEYNNNLISIFIIKRKKHRIYTISNIDNIIDFMNNVLYICRNLGIVTINCLNIMSNIVFLEKLNFKKSFNRYYHMYNYHIDFKVKPSDFAYV